MQIGFFSDQGEGEMIKQRYQYVKYVVLAIAAAGMIFGIVRGEPRVVLKKATNVCLECIGVG